MITFGTGILVLLILLGLSFSLWIIIPAPVFSLLPLSVGTPELSPWLILFNGFALLSSLTLFRGIPFRFFSLPGRWAWFLAALSALALTLSLIPLSQLSSTQNKAEQAMEAALGSDYQEQIAEDVLEKLRSQPFSLLTSLQGIEIPPVREIRALPFASPDGVPLTLNLYRPQKAGTYPALVNIYGGAWQRGTPDGDEKFNRYMAAQGYVVWAISYRHAPQHRFPAQLEDVQAAIAFIQDHATEYETDISRMALLGRSAGSQLAVLAAYGASPVPIRAVVSYYGPVNLTAGYNNVPTPDPIRARSVLKAFLGGTPTQFPELYKQASPLNSVKPNLPPSLLIYGERDNIVQAKYGGVLAEALRSDRNPVALITLPWADHSFDAIFSGISNQLALYYTERFLARILHPASD